MAELTEYSGQIPHFLSSFLSKPASALPKGAQWVVDFEGLKDIRDTLVTTALLEPEKGWDIHAGMDTLIYNEDYKRKGLLFCQAVSIPGESAVVNPEGIQKNHFLMTATGDGRAPYAPTGLRMVFLDTNVSFVDNVVRPWVVTTARLGMIARPKNTKTPPFTNYRQDITVYKLGVLTPLQPPFILQKYTFKGACAIDVSEEEYNYSPATAPVNREATFVYHYYTLETNRNNLAIKYNNENIPAWEATKDKNVVRFIQ